jgi:co-chaperonin GroES (HSP10)
MTTERLPIRAAGWRLIIEPAEVPTKTAGGIELPEDVKASMQYLKTVGQVIDMGPLCFRNDNRFNDADEAGNTRPLPFCKPGDWVLFSRHSGQGFSFTHEGEQRHVKIFNDDEVLAVVDDPSCLVQKL